MKVIYIADDGTHFDNELECVTHEWFLTHRAINDIEFLDKNGNWLGDFLSEDTYNNVMKIVIPNRAAMHDFIDLAQYTGFCAYADIDSMGTWVWDDKRSQFVRETTVK